MPFPFLEYIGVSIIVTAGFSFCWQFLPFRKWNKLKIYNCIVFTGFEPQNFIFLKVSAGGLVLTYSSARYSYKHLYKVYCYRKKREILIRGQCQTLISQIFSGTEAIDKNLPGFCLNVFQLPPSVPLLHMLLLCYLHPLFHVLSS